MAVAFSDVTDDALARLLACAVVSPGLRSLLIEDADEVELESLAGTIAGLWGESAGGQIGRIHLEAATSEGRLWGALCPRPLPQGFTLEWRPGLFAAAGGKPAVVLIPDLARLGRPAVRACLGLLGAAAACLDDRSEPSDPSHLFFLAGCPREQLSCVSAHLLDRFALRIHRPASPERCRAELAARLGATPTASTPVTVAVKRSRPVVLPAALEAVVATTVGSPREQLTLARLAIAEAAVDGAPEVTPAHVRAAARLLGRERPSPPERPAIDEAAPPAPLPSERPAAAAGAPGPRVSQPLMAPAAAAVTVQTMRGPTIAEPPSAAPQLGAPEPAPSATPSLLDGQDVFSARPALQRWFGKQAARGRVVGVEPARGTRDLNVVATTMAAARMHRARNGEQPRTRLAIHPEDLRQNRCLPGPQHFLVLLLDHTCVQGCNWRGALDPYLRRAYQERAAVCLVQVGVQGADGSIDGLRARRCVGRSVLSAHLGAALATPPARATPLAHGLWLAFEALSRSLTLRANPASHTSLIVVTDGRGNVPLAASLEGRLTTRVRAEGVDDALEMARRIAALGVEAVLIDTRPDYAAHLAAGLARALGAAHRSAQPATPPPTEPATERAG